MLSANLGNEDTVCERRRQVGVAEALSVDWRTTEVDFSGEDTACCLVC